MQEDDVYFITLCSNYVFDYCMFLKMFMSKTHPNLDTAISEWNPV